MGKPTFDLYYSEYFPTDAQSGWKYHAARTIGVGVAKPEGFARRDCAAEPLRGAPRSGSPKTACFRNNRGQMKVSNLE
jgi:hypothetical protein